MGKVIDFQEYKVYRDQRKQIGMLIKEIGKKQPIIIGGFKTREEAVRYVRQHYLDDFYIQDDGSILTKGVIQIADGTYYPVFLLIDTEEDLCLSAYFFMKNYDQLLPQEFARPFIGKNIFPYKHWTLSEIMMAL